MNNIIDLNAYKLRKIYEEKKANGELIPIYVVQSEGKIYGNPSLRSKTIENLEILEHKLNELFKNLKKLKKKLEDEENV